MIKNKFILVMAVSLLAVSLAQAKVMKNEDCNEGPIVGGQQTIRKDGKALFFDLQVQQPDSSVCTVHAAIDITKPDIKDWKTYVTDETLSVDNEVFDNKVLSGWMKLTKPDEVTINVTLEEAGTKKIWEFPQFTLIARDGK